MGPFNELPGSRLDRFIGRANEGQPVTLAGVFLVLTALIFCFRLRGLIRLRSSGSSRALCCTCLRTASGAVHSFAVEQRAREQVTGDTDQQVLQKRERGRAPFPPDADIVAAAPGPHPEAHFALEPGLLGGIAFRVSSKQTAGLACVLAGRVFGGMTGAHHRAQIADMVGIVVAPAGELAATHADAGDIGGQVAAPAPELLRLTDVKRKRR